MTENLPHSIAEAKLDIMGVELTVHVLNTGQRIIEGTGLERLFAAMAEGVEMTNYDAMKLAKAVRG